MKTILGLDISSSTIGWAVLSYDESDVELTSYGNIKPPKSAKGSLAYRASCAYDTVFQLLEESDPDFVAIEAYANKFPRGKSTARTIIVLSVFNETMAIASLKALGKEPLRYPVSTIRASLSKYSGEKISSKEDVFDFVLNRFDNFNSRKNRSNNVAKECFDEADAIAVALTHYYKEILNG